MSARPRPATRTTGTNPRPSARTILRHASKLLPNDEPLGLRDAPLKGEDEAAATYRRLRTRADRLAPIWNASGDDPDLQRLRRAIEWAFAAEAADEPSSVFVESFIALEALLGDNDKESRAAGDIANRLADRNAYLIGMTATERTSARKLFKDLYDIRGSVVHGNRSRAAMVYDGVSQQQVVGLARAAITEEARRFLPRRGSLFH
jgi:hypothetical protein